MENFTDLTGTPAHSPIRRKKLMLPIAVDDEDASGEFEDEERFR